MQSMTPGGGARKDYANPSTTFFEAMRQALAPFEVGAAASLAACVRSQLEALEACSTATWPAYTAGEIKAAIPQWWTHGANFSRDAMRVMFGASAARQPRSKLWRIEPHAAARWGLPPKRLGLDGRWLYVQKDPNDTRQQQQDR